MRPRKNFASSIFNCAPIAMHTCMMLVHNSRIKCVSGDRCPPNATRRPPNIHMVMLELYLHGVLLSFDF